MAQSIPTTEAAEWQGASGQKYIYQVLSIDTPFKSSPGNYIYARRTTEGTWQAIYIGQSDNLSRRGEFSLDREQAAISYGATHLHAHLSPENRAARTQEVMDLVQSMHPPLNDAM